VRAPPASVSYAHHQRLLLLILLLRGAPTHVSEALAAL
jgi:hypothetical protein